MMEVLVAVLVFSVGILGMAGMQARAVQMAGDAQQRAEASYLAEQLFARLLISDRASAPAFAHHPGGSERCAPTGAASADPRVKEWLAEVASAFPRAKPQEQQIVVDDNRVTVRLCWPAGENEAPHSLEVRNRIQWP